MTKMSLSKKFFEEITFFGSISLYLFLIIFLYILGKPDYSIKIILALLIIYSLTFIIRLFYFKARPEKVKYSSFIEKIDASSFPSVHAARITVLALLLFFYSTINYYLIALTILVWFLTIYSRFYLKKHDATDLIGGIALGVLTFIIINFI